MNTIKAREQIKMQENQSNIKFYRDYGLCMNGIPQSKSIKEVIRVIDASQEELKYAKRKYKSHADFVGIEARNSFQINQVITSMIKFLHGYNHL